MIVVALACRPASLPSPTPPDWGRAELSLGVRDGVVCDAAGVRAHADRDAPWWSVRVERSAGARITVLQAPERRTATAGRIDRAADPQGLSFGAQGVRFEDVRVGEVELTGWVRCPVVTPIAEDAVLAKVSSVTGAPARPFATTDLGRAEVPGLVSVLVPEGEARDVVQALREALPTGFVAWQGTTRFADPALVARGEVEVVVGPGRTAADIVRLAGVDAEPLGLDPVSLADRVGPWGVEVWAAEPRAITLALPDALPEGAVAGLAELCARAADQGDPLSFVEARTRGDGLLACWWD